MAKSLIVLGILWIAHDLISLGSCATVRSFPKYDYGGMQHEKFIQDALARSSPGSARLLAELFGGLELGLEFKDSQAIITVGGAATRCQHQSPCYDANCKACYDPLLRIHGKCGGASYFTCTGSLPKPCLPFTCTYKGENSPNGQVANDEAVFVKKFPKYEDTFCDLGIEEKSRSLNVQDDFNQTGINVVTDDPAWVMPVPDAVTPCKGYDTCIHMQCGKCYDPYLGTHTTCGKMTYFDCDVSLPRACRPLKCTDSDVAEIFPMDPSGNPEAIGDAANANPKDAKIVNQLMVRNFAPLKDGRKVCL